MWLLDAETLELKQFYEGTTPPYTILSHTWGAEEVSFQEMQSLQRNTKLKEGYKKIRNCCSKTIRDGYLFTWVDTCCIDKSSSAELSEAINSMFRWYHEATVCYAYLSDCTGSDPSRPFEKNRKSALPGQKDDNPQALHYKPKLSHSSRWFRRGWTLQELIAPKVLEFLAEDWSHIGTKLSLQDSISAITGISLDVLRGGSLSACTVAERMGWAANRDTTRLEDIAYSLLGIFQVHMPLLYGEGRRAFIRLQEEIMKTTEDYTLFAWQPPDTNYWGTADNVLSPLADDVSCFDEPQTELGRAEGPVFSFYSDPVINTTGDNPDILENLLEEGVVAPQAPDSRPFATLGHGGIKPIRSTDDDPPSVTGRGLRISLPLRPYSDGLYLACINCRTKKSKELLCMILRTTNHDRSRVFQRIRVEKAAWAFLSFHSHALEGFALTSIYIEIPKTNGQELRLSQLQPSNLFRDVDYLSALGYAQLDRGRHDVARAQFEKVMWLKKTELGENHPLTLEVVRYLAMTYEKEKGREARTKRLNDILQATTPAQRTIAWKAASSIMPKSAFS